MPALHDLQQAFLQAMLGAEAPQLLGTIAADGLLPSARLHIYRHHVLTSLTEALKATYPVICRLVDARFFGYAADAYIRAHLPQAPCLFEYGADFPDFLATFPPCLDLVYLADVARLEWAMHAAWYAETSSPLDPVALGSLAADDIARILFQFDPSMTLLSSPWPLEDIWRAHQDHAALEAPIDLNAGGVALEIRRWDDDVVFRRLDPPTTTFRTALRSGQPLGLAVEITLAATPAFDCASALHALLADSLVTGFTLAS